MDPNILFLHVFCIFFYNSQLPSNLIKGERKLGDSIFSAYPVLVCLHIGFFVVFSGTILFCIQANFKSFRGRIQKGGKPDLQENIHLGSFTERRRPLGKNLQITLNKRTILLVISIAFITFLTASLPANALITKEFLVNIDYADSINPFGVSAGDTFIGSTTYDETLLTGYIPGWYAYETLSPLDSDDNFAGLIGLSIPLGNVTFDEMDDREYPYFPSVFFSLSDPNIGEPIGIDLVVDIGDLDGFEGLYYTAYMDSFRVDIMDGGTIIDSVVEGSFDFATPVPEPGTLLLFGIGLIGIEVFRRKKFLW
jgi:hypothetical protein